MPLRPPASTSSQPASLSTLQEQVARLLWEPMSRRTSKPGAFARAARADSTGAAACFRSPIGAAVDAAGTVYVPDMGNHVIRKITPAGVVSTLAGAAGSSGSADGVGPAARFSSPTSVAVDAAGAVYVADQSNHTIRVIR